MHFRTTLLVLALIGLAAMPALAHKDTAKVAPYHMSTSPDSRDIYEGFEGAFPPAGWTAVSASGHSGTDAWYQGTNSFEGLYAASIDYDDALVPQDCTLSFMNTVTAGESHLNFQISGSAYWSTNYDCTVEIDGAIVYSWAANVVDNWVFQLVDIDLAAYLGQTVEIAFHYTGLDGAAIYLDAVGLNEGATPPPPPVAPLNDTCDGAGLYLDFNLPSGTFSFTTDNTSANSDYPLASGSCTSYSATGNDVVYYVCLNQGEMLDVAMDATFDASLYIISDCDDAMGTCLAGADATVTGTEAINGFVAPAGGTYFVIVSAYSSGIGAITVTGTNYGVGCVAATESTTFDGLKSLYR